MKKINLAFIFGQLALIAAVWQSLPPQLPLFYSRPWGEEQLTSPIGLLLLPGLSSLIMLVNLFLPTLVPQQERLTTQILTSASTIFSLACLLTLIKIVFLVSL